MIERNAETLLEEIGIEFRDFPRALELFQGGGLRHQGRARALSRAALRVSSAPRRPRNMCSTRATPSATCMIGGNAMVFAPNYGSPFVHDLDKGRRYGTIEDFHNFVKLAYLEPLHPPFRRHGVRAGRSAGQQAASRDGLCAYATIPTSRSWAR